MKPYSYNFSIGWAGGILLPLSQNWDRISRGDVRHQVVLTVRPNAHFAYSEPLPKLDQSRFGKEITRRRLSEEIDGQVSGDRQWHPADRRKNRHVHGHVREGHDDRPRNR